MVTFQSVTQLPLQQSRIITNAHRINEGLMPDLAAPEADSDFYFVPADSPETAVPRIIELVKTRIPRRFGLNQQSASSDPLESRENHTTHGVFTQPGSAAERLWTSIRFPE
jgi:hypothetical protein